ncbi:MAG: MFS transporter [Candidatus Melainabacteria bacterium]|nr:MFS transporter [Candidatus Melainabacteria bacterium]
MPISPDLTPAAQTANGDEFVTVSLLEGASLTKPGDTSIKATTDSNPGPAGKGEILAWASYDIANATYGTVVATAIYNAYFVGTVWTPEASTALFGFSGTFLLTCVICLSALTIVVTAPVIGTIADATASKKKLLLISTAFCILCTASLGFIAPGQIWYAMIALYLANTFFGTGEDLVASFLPELATQEQMGRVSALGWAAGYVGSLIALGLSFAFIEWAKTTGALPTTYVPQTMLICAVMFSLFSVPTFIWLKERARPDLTAKGNVLTVGFKRFKHTLSHRRHYRDLFNFLLTMLVYSCGTTTIIHLASVYAQKVLFFTTQESIILILAVSLIAAIGAGIFGFIQDKIGSIKTLIVTLVIWTIATVIAFAAQEKAHLWISSVFIGLAMGATGSASRALVGQFSPAGRSGEFLGLWGVAHKLATAIGAATFGTVLNLSNENYRMAVLSCAAFFIVGMVMLLRVDENRGKLAARLDADVPV